MPLPPDADPLVLSTAALASGLTQRIVALSIRAFQQ